ncbi:SDR family NAD(P)-dependent oxidoreductase [Flavobacterium sp.]|uniref:SDR family NAD(P)-dependent oxidoreductase n=1 Tax=Flavobacterium sp. TaxID=239 RepID=UPI003C649919
MSKLRNKIALVTGASKGIGAEIAKEMAKEGAKVVVNFCQDKKGADAVVSNIIENGGTAIAIQADVTQEQDVVRLFKETIENFGQIDILINNAGVYQFEPLEMVTKNEFYRQFDSNVWSVFLCIQESLKHFNPLGGAIVNISSVASIKATPMTSLYSATKAAVDAITQTSAKELANKNIRVNSILPGPTETEGNPVLGTAMENFIVANTPLGRVGKPTDFSKLAVFLASDDSSWITGQKIVVSGGFD